MTWLIMVLIGGIRPPAGAGGDVLDDLAHDPVLQALPVAAVVTDVDGRVVAWNHQAEVLYGWRAEDVLGRPVATVSDDVDDVFGAMASSQGIAIQIPVPRPDGSRTLVNATTTPIRDKGGAVVGLLRLAEDVAGQHLGPSIHAETSERIRLAIEAAELGTWESDTRTGSMHISPRFEEILGLARGTFRGTFEALLEQVHPDDRPALVSAREDALAHDDVIRLEYRVVRPNGQLRWVEGRGHLRVADGEVVGSIGVVLDVTDRRLAENERDALAAVLDLQARSLELLAELDVAHRLQVLADVLVPGLADCCAIHLTADDGVSLAAVRHAAPEHAESFRALMDAFPVTLDQPYGTGAVLATGKPQFLPRVTDDVLVAVTTTREQLEEFRALDLRSGYVVPLVSRGRVLGSIALGRVDDRPWVDSDLTLAEQIAATAAVAIDNAQLFMAEREARSVAERNEQRLQLLADVTAALSRTLNIDDVVGALTELLIPHYAELCVIDVIEDERPRMVSVHGVRPETAELFRAAEEMSPRRLNPDTAMSRCIRLGEPVLIRDLDRDYLAARALNGEQLQLYLDMRLRSGVVAPLTARGRVVGAISLFGVGDGGHVYDADHGELMVEIGRRAGLAVDNARLYTHQHAVAEALQRSLLPELKPLPGLDIAARYLPSSEHAQVGGDWFDAFPLADGAVGIAVGDAMGHDPRASGAMGQLRSVLRSYAFEGAPAAVVLDKLDRLVQEFAMAQLATVLYGRLEPADADGAHVLRYCSAGHPPAVLRRPSGEVQLLDQAQSVVIGAPLEQSDRIEALLRLEPGSLLVCYTDGLIEGRGRGLEDGINSLLDAVRTMPPDVTAHAACDALVVALAAGDRDDDVAVMAIRVGNAAG